MPQLTTQVQEKDSLVKRLGEDRGKLVAKGSEVRLSRLQLLTAASEKVAGYVRYYKAQEQQILLMQDEVNNVRRVVAPSDLRDIQARHTKSGLGNDEWNAFFRDYKGDVGAILSKMLLDAQKNRDAWIGIPPTQNEDSQSEYVAEGANLEECSLSLLEAEIDRLQQLVSIDEDTAKRFKELSIKITTETELLRASREKLNDHVGASQRLEVLVGERCE